MKPQLRKCDAHVNAWQQWTIKHDAHVKEWRSDTTRMAAWRTKHDAAYCLNQRMRNAIKKALREGKAGRTWESLVGYKLDDLIAHLARTIPKGYSLADIFGGKLHIDHIVPKSRFDVTDPEELRAAWALPNLQLLTARDNLRKNNKVVTLL